MQIHSNNFRHDEPIPEEFAFGKAGSGDQPIMFSSNRNPHLAWSGAPADTRSCVLVCIDPDVPSRGDDVNQEGKTVPRDLPRVDFAQWLMIDIPPSVTAVEAGACSAGITPHGKRQPPGPAGSRQGRNDYTGWFANDPDMAGDYYGYDGPCPPWNDALLHRYRFRVYALDTDRLHVSASFDWDELQRALQGHVLDQAELTGTYTINPSATRG